MAVSVTVLEGLLSQDHIISQEFAGQRLDNYLFRHYRKIPKSRVYKMLRKGEVRVNGSRKKQAYRLCEGDKLRLPPDHVVESSVQEVDPSAIPPQWIDRLDNAVIYEDEHLLVLNKPSGLAVHAGSGLNYGVIEILRAARPQAPFLELVHRLDRETSGVLFLAKSRQRLVELHALMREGEMEKKYRVLLLGDWQGGDRRVDNQLVRTGSGKQVRRTEVSEDGKEAVSDFRPLRRFAEATLMEVQIYTGRTHQIRVQAEGLGHPVLGDDKYGDFPANKVWRKQGLKRLFLHCASMSCQLPGSGERLAFEAPLAPDLEKVLDLLEASS